MNRLPAHFRRMQNLLRYRGRTREEAEDLIQDAFLKMQAYCNEGGEVRQPEGFLVRTVLRLAINARRDEHRELYVDEQVEELKLLIDANPAPDEVLAAEQCLDRMWQALDRVHPRSRDAFLMHRLDGLSYVEIAHRLHISVSAVEKHIARALAALSEVNESP